MVSRTKTFFYSSRSQRAQRSVLLLLPSTSRRSELPGYVHPRHGIRDVHSTLHVISRSSGSVPSRGYGSDSHSCLRGRSGGDTGTQVWDIHIKHKQRQPVARPRRIFWIQIRWRYCHAGRGRDTERWEGDRRLDRVDCLHVYIFGQCLLPRESPALLPRSLLACSIMFRPN